ncbi:glucosidase II beta subunit-like protein-domain-containing protein [Astrocystis sublimbata]|nr:glucosidase II beta subunit-like protein-domain-containing protein [Astrocystis sublimbata]
MRRPHPVWAAWTLAHLCRARQPGFSVHHDLLAYPQFEVVISDTFISESAAQALLDKKDADTTGDAHPSYDAGLAGQTDLAQGMRAADAQDAEAKAQAQPTHGHGRGGRAVAESYEVMSAPPHRYLCTIPIIEPAPAPNKTATELAKQEEARELARASAHGWDLINELDGTCLYYMSGWWSYRFCYGQDVVQFHAVASSVKGGPPMRDINTAEYVLGRSPDPHASSSSRSSRRGRQNQQQQQQQQQQRKGEQDNNNNAKNTPAAPGTPTKLPPNADLQVKGDQRYLVQRMGDGTLCDLTGRERTIEIQYHCSPESTQDRIGWIKEVTTCSYLMLVNTPRLCVDVAFQPPKEERANVISCRAIVSETAQADWHAQKTLEAQAFMAGRAKEAAKAPIVIGGVVVGGRHLLGKGEDGKEAPKLAPPRNYRSSPIGGNLGKLVEIIASANAKDGDNGGEVNIMTEDQLQERDLSPEVIDSLRKELQNLAGDRGWQLKMVEGPGNNRELVGYIDEDEDEDESGGGGEAKGKTNKKGDSKPGEGQGGQTGQAEGQEKKKGEKDQGSEEQFFKEEL